MKVNIHGTGNIPYINLPAPQYNVELKKDQIIFLTNVKQLRVYEAKSGKLITKTNYEEFFSGGDIPEDLRQQVIEIITEWTKEPDFKDDVNSVIEEYAQSPDFKTDVGNAVDAYTQSEDFEDDIMVIINKWATESGFSKEYILSIVKEWADETDFHANNP
jgi:predicted house-cleaning noncanonical NTP pyrophosphatase (MazG superfamily)